MTLAYFDYFSGISGDMTLGALVDAGLPLDVLRSELAKLGLPGYTLSSEMVRRSGLAATKVHVFLDEKEQPAGRLGDIRSIISGSSLSPAVKQRSLAIFERLADGEAKVRENQRLFFDSSRDLSAELERFYERFLAGDDAFFAFLRDYTSRYSRGRATAYDFFAVARQNTTADIADLVSAYFRTGY